MMITAGTCVRAFCVGTHIFTWAGVVIALIDIYHCGLVVMCNDVIVTDHYILYHPLYIHYYNYTDNCPLYCYIAVHMELCYYIHQYLTKDHMTTLQCIQ